MLQFFLLLLLSFAIKDNLSIAAELDTAGKVRFLLGQPPEETWLSQEQFQHLKNQSQLLQDMPESDQAYEFQNVSKKNFHILSTLAALDTKAYFPKQKVISLLYTRNENENRTGLLYLDKTLLTPEASNCVESIDLPTLVGIMHDADYLLMDRIVSKSIHAFALFIGTDTSAWPAVLNREFDSMGLTADLKQRIITFLIQIVHCNYTRTDVVFVSEDICQQLSPQIQQLSPSGKIVAFSDLSNLPAHNSNNTIVSSHIKNGITYIQTNHQHLCAFNQTETLLAIQQQNGALFVVPVNQAGKSWTYLDRFPQARAIAFNTSGTHLYMLFDDRAEAIDLQTKQRHIVMTVPADHTAVDMSRYANVIACAHTKDTTGIIYLLDTGETFSVSDKPHCCDTLGRFVVLSDLSFYDITKRKLKKLYSTKPLGSVHQVLFDSQSTRVVLDSRLKIQNVDVPAYFIFNLDTGTLNEVIYPESQGASRRSYYSNRAPLHLSSRNLSVYDCNSKKFKSITLQDKRQNYRGISLEGLLLSFLMRGKDHESLYMRYKDIYDTLPKAVKSSLSIGLATKAGYYLKQLQGLFSSGSHIDSHNQ